MYQKNPKLGQLQAKVDPETLIPSIIFLCVVLLDFSQFPRAALSNRNIMRVTFVVINILLTMLKKKHNFNNILHVTPYVQNIAILICNQCKVINEIFIYIFHAMSSKSYIFYP